MVEAIFGKEDSFNIHILIFNPTSGQIKIYP